jgi:nucleotide-binding universal stress UspA family protein
MFKNILVPTDGSKRSAKAVEVAINLAKVFGAKITTLQVIPEYQMFVDEGFVVPKTTSQSLITQFKKQTTARSKEILDEAHTEAVAAGIECEAVSVSSSSPYDAIIKQATKSKCDLIVMASHGRKGLEGLLLGSETAKVLVHSKVPVLVVR